MCVWFVKQNDVCNGFMKANENVISLFYFEAGVEEEPQSHDLWNRHVSKEPQAEFTVQTEFNIISTQLHFSV